MICRFEKYIVYRIECNNYKNTEFKQEFRVFDIYLFSRIQLSRSSYFISPEATASPTLATSSTVGWIRIPLLST